MRPLLVTAILVVGTLFSSSFAQNESGTLHGRVTDPTGAVIPSAVVTATGANGQKGSATTDAQGAYEIKDLAAGSYTVSTTAKGFSTSSEQNINVAAGQAQQYDIALDIAVKPEKVEVEDQGTTVSTSAADNASSLIIKGQDLDALPDDPDELQQDLEALAGPSAGPNGGQIYIDGFTGGQLPPKSSIREIRLNQNPFSSEYDKLGYGRIEILTKPGTDQYHGQFMLDGNASPFNSTNPFVSTQPSYHSELFNASIGGPISKKASFFSDVQGRDINDQNIVTATIADTANNFAPTPFSDAVPNPRFRLNVGPRIDYQISQNNTLTARYQYFHDSETNQGIGQFSLPSQGYNSVEDEHTLQLSDTQVLNSNVVNETRFQYVRDSSTQTVQNFGPTITVLGNFTDGGNSLGNLNDTENRYELQNYTSVVHKTHLFKFGGRLRVTDDSSQALTNFNGVFTFSTFPAYQNFEINNQACPTGSSPNSPTNPCGPSQFSITQGRPLTQVSYVDLGAYAQDDWRVRPNLTFSYGLRFETQNAIHDHADLAPRVSFAYGLGHGTPKTVLRGGFGIFYDRFSYNLIEQADRLNGINQQQFIVTDPTFFTENIPPFPAPGATISPTIYRVSPNLRAPYTMQSAVSVERQVSKKATMALTYLNSRGEHQLFLQNINAPLPGSYTGPGTGIRPLFATEGDNNVYQYTSEGIYRQNQLIANVRVSAGTRLSLFGFYTLNYAKSDLGAGTSSGGAAGAFSGGSTATPNFLTNQYDPMADYGPSSFDVRHRVFLGGTVGLPYLFRLSPMLIASSGSPYDITAGQDLNGDSIFNDRPNQIAVCPSNLPAGTTCLNTPLGTFTTAQGLGTPVRVNSETGPSLVVLHLRLSKTFGLGREVKGGTSARQGGSGGGGGGRGGPPGGGLGPGGLSGMGRGGGGMFGGGATTDRRYNLTFTVSARNALNHVNLAAPIGDLNSPFFGQSIALAGGPYSSASAVRRIDLQVLFSF